MSFVEQYIISPYGLNLLIFIGIYIILALGLHITFGIGGLFNLAHVAAYALGAYTTALLAVPEHGGAGLFTCLIFSMLLTGMFALLLGGISLRLQRDYFAIGTLAFSSIVSALLINWRSLTRGVLGIPGIPKPELGGFEFDTLAGFLGLLYFFVVGCVVLLLLYNRSTFIRLLRAQAESINSTEALGWDTRLIKNAAFVLSSMLAGLAGAFFAYHMSYIDPSSFGLHEMVFVLTIVVVGRPGSLLGLLLATVFLVLLPEILRFVDIPSQFLGPARQLLYALILFGVVYWQRFTLFPVEREV